ncbi:Bbox zinc finger domain containing protein [Acanthamoeba castellanii str. Neff]|uniref:Bbox zinc finger domain containing protein n=1 Tax=Acanthamoeba castellanii (strain ATCC 30010 / Neff) TaxID=1257118 RepID=L8GT32_ACACF|nr:Bbox zinc finger domain containing protein [Acanthamoeba castellanii str. Neff]ELR15768.1 Bbox zinc finger domain containing protein [Acanthamoeba castellanii str. Neff]
MNHHPTLTDSAAEEDKDDVGTCSVCLVAFSASEADHVPRLLKCGHSFCTACLTRLLDATPSTPTPTNSNSEAELEEATRPLRCPKCRTVTRVRLVDGEAAAPAEGVKGLPRNFDLIDLLSSSSSSAMRQPRPTVETSAAAAAALKCANCSQAAAEKFCEQCGGAHLCMACDAQLHGFPALRSHVRVASADAPEPRAACEHHRAKKVEMWCERDGVAVCVVCLVAGPHKGHDAVTIEEAEQRVREAARVELAQVEAAMGEVEAAVERQAAREAAEQASAREARAAIKQHFDQMREAVAQRERVLGAEVDEWERTTAEAAAKRQAQLAEAHTRLAAAGKALQQQQLLQCGGLGRSATWGDSAAVCQAARTAAAAAAAAARGMQASSIALTSEDTWAEAVGSSGRLERRTAAAGGVVRDYTVMTAAQRTLGSVDQFRRPWAVAVDAAAGHIVVADCSQVHVCRADDGSCVRTWGTTPGSGAQIGTLWGVAVDHANGHIVVTDIYSHRLHVWRADDGSFVRTFGSRGSGPGQFQCPRGVAVDKAGHIIVTDSNNHRVQVWRAYDGSFLRTFGSRGAGPGQFQQPAGVAVDAATGNIIVADSGNHRVHVWHADGSFVRTFGSRGHGQDQFNSPAGVAVDTAGNVIVADWGNHRVQVWRAYDGSFLRTFGSQGGGPAQFNRPTGVAVDAATGHIIVADSSNKRVQVW